eukprot:GILK01009157.1.p1 GENE.GILK01009157.1~~GILK01009157.1.p1  ORF type:complete len:741 (+),score=59.92 GILK01009157.1:311-2533(+)
MLNKNNNHLSPFAPRSDVRLQNMESNLICSMRPFSLEFSNREIEQRYKTETGLNGHRSKQKFILFSYAYVIIRVWMVFCAVDSLSVHAMLTKIFVLFICHMLVSLKLAQGTYLRVAGLFLSCSIINSIVEEPLYPGFYFLLIENQILQGVIYLRQWKQHLLFCSVEMLYFLVSFGGLRVEMARLFVHLSCLTLLQTAAVWFYERELRLQWVTEATLLQQKQRFKVLMGLLPHPVLVSTCRILLYCNAAAKHFVREGPGLFQQMEALVASDDISRFGNFLRNTLSGIPQFGQQFIFKTLDGDPRRVDVGSSCLDWDGQQVAMIVVHDITRLKHSQKVANDFLASCSHEMRTPLNCIMGMLELILEEVALPSHVGKCAAAASQSATHLHNLIDDVLDTSQLAAGKRLIRKRSFNPVNLLQETVESVAYQAKRRNVRIYTECDPGMSTWFMGDSHRFQQVLLHLLSNALKFTSDGEIQITLQLLDDSSATSESTQRQEHNYNVTIKCTVADTGVGIHREDVQHLLILFGKLPSQQHVSPVSSGLGLTRCKTLCADMQGDIGVESKPGKGSKFWFTVPLRRAAVASVTCSQTDYSSPNYTPGPPLPACAEVGLPVRSLTSKPVILLVEDNDFNIAVMHGFLDQDYQVMDALNGAVAVDMFRRDPARFDIVLMDCEMPVMSGFEATRQIRHVLQSKHLPNVPIIAVSASANRDKCLDCGMDDYLAKPVSKKLLCQTIDEWLNSRF